MTSGDLTNAEWELVEPLLATGRGRPGHENRRHLDGIPVSYTHLTLPTTIPSCISRWSPYH